jgi:hypothetical protein
MALVNTLTVTSMCAYKYIDTNALATDHATVYNDDIHNYAISTMAPSTESALLYKMYVQLITSLKWFQYRCLHGLVNPCIELARTMKLNAAIETMLVRGVHVYIPTLFGNIPTYKQSGNKKEEKEKIQFISEACEYINIRTADDHTIDGVRDHTIDEVREYLTRSMPEQISMENLSNIMIELSDIIIRSGTITFDKHTLMMWAIEEYISFSFGDQRVY